MFEPPPPKKLRRALTISDRYRKNVLDNKQDPLKFIEDILSNIEDFQPQDIYELLTEPEWFRGDWNINNPGCVTHEVKKQLMKCLPKKLMSADSGCIVNLMETLIRENAIDWLCHISSNDLLPLIRNDSDKETKVMALMVLSMLPYTNTTVETVWELFISEEDGDVKDVKGAAIECLGAMEAGLNSNRRTILLKELQDILKNSHPDEEDLLRDAYNCGVRILIGTNMGELGEAFHGYLLSWFDGDELPRLKRNRLKKSQPLLHILISKYSDDSSKTSLETFQTLLEMFTSKKIDCVEQTLQILKERCPSGK